MENFGDKATDIRPYIKDLFQDPILFSHLMNRIPTSLAILDKEMRTIFLNRSLEALTGFTSDQVRGVPCRHVLRTNLCGKKCPVHSMGPDSEPICVEADLVNRSREKIPVRVSMAPITDESGHLTGWLETFEDLRVLRARETEQSAAFSFGPLLGRSPKIEHVFQMVSGIAQTNSSVLITGETGTGKDVLAEVIHQQSPRAQGPFVKVNCGALPESLLESELFGHRKGAFTGANENKPGRFKLAHNGSLFLTEIGDLPINLQIKLLSFLDDQVIYPLGSTKGTQVNVRIIAATHRDLQKMVEERSFREDLLFRLNVVQVHLPPLREREGDVDLLLDHFLRQYVERFKKDISGLARETRRLLLDYNYPGNVRELKNIIEFAVNICPEGTIEPEHLPKYIQDAMGKSKAKEVAEPLSTNTDTSDLQRLSEAKYSSWPEIEKQMILDALLKAKGRRKKAAEILGWGRSTLWRKIKQHGLEESEL